MKEQMMEKLQEIEVEIFESFKIDEIQQAFTEQSRKLLMSCMELIFSNFYLALKTDDIDQKLVDDSHDQITLLLKMLEKMIALQAITQKTKDFVSNVLKCIHNYNTNILRNSEVADSIHICQRLIISSITMLESINILKSLIMHLESKELKEKDPLYKGLTEQYIKLLET